MAHLSNVADLTKKVVEILAISITALILLIILFRVGSFVKETISPTPPAPPTVTFGKLTNISFPQNIDTQKYSYTINTLSGSLPMLPDRVTVYKMQQPTPSLLGLDKAKSIVAGVDFTANPTQLSTTSYQWNKTDPLPTTLTMDIQSFDFTFKAAYENNPTVAAATSLPDETLAQTVSKAFFDKIMPLPDSIDPSKTKTTLLAIGPTGILPASSLSTAQLIRVDYFPQAIDKISIYTANPTESFIYTLVASSDTNYPQVVEAGYVHKVVSTTKATYPIKTAAQAFDELKQGKGYIAANPTGTSQITITNVGLGYYIQPTNQQYLWPIIVFQGDKGFYAYVSAIPDQWIQK